MVVRPQSSPREILHLLPLSLLLGGLLGLGGGILSAQLPILEGRGPEFGRWVTCAAAGVGSLASLCVLVALRRWLLGRTTYRFGREGLELNWPGQRLVLGWSAVERVEQRDRCLRLLLAESRFLELFNLKDPAQTEDLVRGFLRGPRVPVASSRAA